ncbi:GAF domain-containing protein [Leifsonia sp. A12D58]|uniref:GAF domain-containing protein n=1 Tax=Leifsonia sp. A12D58 TaxID=3397674 RepID=UPI0039E1FCD5
MLDPDKPLTGPSLADDDLREYRSSHPLALVLPTIHNLLIRHTYDASLIVAVGDQAGRLLWVDGDRTLRHKAESMLFIEGADWSETAVGTSAPGTALALDRSMQIRGTEHFNRIVHPWSCSAVPVHDPSTGVIIGVIDITGGDDAVGPIALPLIEATVAAVEAELKLRRLDELLAHSSRSAHSLRSRTRQPRPAQQPRALLTVLGTESGRLEIGETSVGLSLRHAEILTLLAWHHDGLSARALAELLYGSDDALVTVRAEMVRLRRVLERRAPMLTLESKPYRVTVPLELDAQRVLAFLTRGAHKVALAAYAGPLLGASESPGISAIRAEVSGALRTALLTDASIDTLLAYARTDDAAFNREVWHTCLTLLPTRSPKRAAVVARIELIDSELGGAARR